MRALKTIALDPRLSSAFLALVVAGCPSPSDEGSKETPVSPPPTKQAPSPPPAPPPPTAPTAAGGGTGSISGTVGFTGQLPAAKKLDMKSKPDCAKLNPNSEVQRVNAEGGKLAEVYVHVKSGLAKKAKFEKPTDPVVLNQKGCRYSPSVLALQTGQELHILNSDPTLHNVNVQGKRDKFNLAMPKQGMKIVKKFKKPQAMIPVKCDTHPWMEARINASKHPFFALSGKDGSFKIEDLPSGTYTLEFVHWALGSQEREVKVDAGKTATADITFESKG